MAKSNRSKKYFTLKLQAKFLIRFTQLIENGFPFVNALEVAQTLFDEKAIALMIEACVRGDDFSDTLEEMNFEQRIVYIVRAGERSNALLRGLQAARNYSINFLENRSEMKKKLRYPLFLFSVVILVLVALFIFFIPQLEDFYETFNISNDGTFISGIIWVLGITLILALIVVIFVMMILKLDHPKFQRFVFGWTFRIYGVKFVSQKLFSYYFATQVSMFTSCGLSLKDSMETILNFEKLPLIKLIVRDLQAQIEDGKEMGMTIRGSAYFTPYFKLIVSHSLNVGNLDSELENFVKAELTNLNEGVGLFLKTFQACFMMLIGILIVMLYLSILQPIFEMIDII